jgi:hypothetical protein
VEAIVYNAGLRGHASRGAMWRAFALALLSLAWAVAARGQEGTHSSTSSGSRTVASSPADERDELVVDGNEGNYVGDVIVYGRRVTVRGTIRHGVLVFGGDVIVEGRVEGDVGVVGGTVTQREGSYIGGDVMVIGGAYHHGKVAPGRNPESTTVMIAGYEEELREMARNPASVLAPAFSPTYLGMRLLSILVWFIFSLAVTAVTPGAVSRAAARLQLTSMRVALIGVVGAVVIGPGVVLALRFLPPMLGLFVWFTAFVLLLVAFLFGRVVVHAATGRWLQRVLLSEERRSESVALLLGASFWALVLSLPYVWPLVLAGLAVVSLGLALTARYPLGWRRAS